MNNDERIARIERRISLILVISVVQTVAVVALCVCLLVNKFLASTLPTVLVLVVIALLAYFFRKQIPGWFGSLSRYLFSKMLDSQKTGSKDHPIH
ncbi:MAG: hypothetical protein AAF939_05375 [Planctomycetota bacterium]